MSGRFVVPIFLCLGVGCSSGTVETGDATIADAGTAADARSDQDATLGADARLGADATTPSDASTEDAGTAVGGSPGPRQGHHAVLLSDGRALIAGGFGPDGDPTQYETFVFDPSNDRWTRGPTLPSAHQNGVLIPLQNARAMLVGGCRMEGLRTAECFDRVDIIDVATGTVTRAGRLARARTVTHVLPVTGGPLDGQYLIIGGTVNSVSTRLVEVYDPLTGTSTDVPSLTYPSSRIAPTVTPLRDGRILIAGGNERSGGSGDLATALILDPVALTLVSTNGTLAEAKRSAGAATLADGTVMIIHGEARSDLTIGLELFNPATGTFSTAANQPVVAERFSMGVVTLSDQRVLIIGGSDGNVVDDIEVYTPGSGFSTLPTRLRPGVAAMTATLLRDGRVLVVGGQSPNGMIIADPQIITP